MCLWWTKEFLRVGRGGVNVRVHLGWNVARRGLKMIDWGDVVRTVGGHKAVGCAVVAVQMRSVHGGESEPGE